MSEPLVGPDAAEIEKPGPAFDGAGPEPDAALDDAAPAAVELEVPTPSAEAVAEPGDARSGPEAEPDAALDDAAPAAVVLDEPEVAEPDPVDTEDAATLEAQLLAAAPEEAIEDSGLPDLTDDATFEAALESVLLVVDSPIGEDALSSALEQPVKRIKQALRRLSTRYTESGSGIDLRRAGDGWRFYTRDRFAPFVEKLLLDGQRAKLTRAALETLAVIAYRQPVTRARIAAVRGVNVDGVIRTLVARGLIEETGTDSDTGGILYRTTELFLERLGLSSLADLPPIAPLLPEVDAIDDV
ncbi:SMC-Scp complex subunit ScpB [Lentzea sp. BCCO 10_0798]|uniref:SMC-Scp complex subunit ScpB n=1 Tax=Lentzea kristufekii TaxID=3095430 RepID=A0ABU4U5W4_9PSEU|nr:SMC-Scp complex subunit ScpB [Lentzea sp. BCCO 10_0798]MDX8055497.1 SMC-Scp complex subunit ScpB [Lentzea sp. BCCO 10_0798]